jgi:tRNA pseudouridine55 synthase
MANGVVVVDKPRGPTSFDVVAQVRRVFGEKRVGHAGTLDPMATGVLPVCVGEATKLVQFLTGGEKEYQAEALLGVATDTLDATGAIVREADASAIGEAAVQEVLASFLGTVMQKPPMHSAIRVGGKRLYELARQGVEVEREAREVQIHDTRLSAFAREGARVRISFTVRCGKGTYIRSIAGDLGDRLGVGAHLTALRRTRVGAFRIDGAVPLDRLAPETPLLGLAESLADLPSIPLDAQQAKDVRDGKLATVGALPVLGDFVRLLRPDGSLLAVASPSGGRLKLARVFR